MKKKTVVYTAIASISSLCIAGMIMAGTTVPDVIKMEDTKAYKKHTKAIVEFTHKKHIEDYKIGCGECHHDKNGKPLDLKAGDDVQKCVDCHKPGKAKLTKEQKESMSRDEQKAYKLSYHYGAIHANCLDCHKDYNKEKTGKKTQGPAPTKCTECHPKQQ